MEHGKLIVESYELRTFFISIHTRELKAPLPEAVPKPTHSVIPACLPNCRRSVECIVAGGDDRFWDSLPQKEGVIANFDHS